jgi:hypothetical protein
MVPLLGIGALLWVMIEVLAPILRHEHALWGLRRTLAGLKHPLGTTRISSASAVGLLSGNGNHCDFVAYEVRSGALGWGELSRAYEPQPVDAELGLYLVRNGAVVQSTGGDPYFDRIGVSTAGLTQGYVVGVRWYGQNPEDDIRCY